MAGIFGNHPEDRARQAELTAHLRNHAYNQRVEALAKDKFMALPDFYSKSSDKYRYTNIEDAIDSVKQEEWVCIARALRDEDNKLAGDILAAALMWICVSDAQNEMEDSDD